MIPLVSKAEPFRFLLWLHKKVYCNPIQNTADKSIKIVEATEDTKKSLFPLVFLSFSKISSICTESKQSKYLL